MRLPLLLTFLGATATLAAQSPAEVDASVTQSLEDALATLSTQREAIAEDKVPLSRELNTLQNQVIKLRSEADRTARNRDAGEIGLTALEADVAARTDQADYVRSLLVEYVASIESRADASERPRWQPGVDAALRAVDDPELDEAEKLAELLAGVEMGMQRLEGLIGGVTFSGEALEPTGNVIAGDFILYGPVTYFASGEVAGLALPGDAGVPGILATGADDNVIASTASTGSGALPLDPTLGRAIALASTRETLPEHIAKGGIWIWPILGSAALALAIALFKFAEVFSLKRLPRPAVKELVELIQDGQIQEARAYVKKLGGPGGEMLQAGVANLGQSKELMEEILLEKMVEFQPKLERLIPIIAVTAATAPLLGLLGTVTGMINTFKLITIFGTGDARSLSSGISEALITTEFGLIVAIPALILHAVLSRRAKSIMARLENVAMSFINGVYAKELPKEEEAA